MWKHAWYAISRYVECLYNACLRVGYFPRELLVSSGIVVLKGPDGVRSMPRSYRSILDAYSIAFERMLFARFGEKVQSSAVR